MSKKCQFQLSFEILMISDNICNLYPRIIVYLMTDFPKKKIEKINIKFPDLKQNSEEEYKQKQLTDPPLLKKGNLKPNSNNDSDKSIKWNKLLDIFEKTQTEFSHIYKQILAINQRQDAFNDIVLQSINTGAGAKRKKSGAALEDLEARYRYFLVEPAAGGERRINALKLKRWLGRVFTETFSVAFQRFSKGEMNFDQTKIYCSSNILRNLVSLNDKIELTTSNLQAIEQQMGRLLRYLQLKYPLTESTQINKALQSAVQEVDNMGLLAHNYFASSKIVFQWRESGNYNDLIMKMLNDVFSRLDEKSLYDKKSNYIDFKNFMTNLFQSVEQQDDDNETTQEDPIPGILDFITDRFVRAKSALRQRQPNTGRYMKDSSKIRQEKEKYRNKVKEYTKFSIGRKVPESLHQYTEKEIQSMNLVIKSPSVLRILTKWTEELRAKFTTPSYYANLSDGIKSQRSGTVHSLLFPLRRLLDQEISKQEEAIKTFLKNLGKDNLDLELKLLKKELKEDNQGLQELRLEQICGRYSIQVVNSLHSNLINYLNRLIHGLTSVAKSFYQNIKAGQSEWSSPPDLVTFTIGDLMRSKISSRQKEILKIYDQLKQYSIRQPEKLKIIRVKNRLSKSTNDILVNAKFNNLITVQIQLAVNTHTSEFIKCSNAFCHYLYELERSPFGAIAQLCNIWAALDRTAQSFKQDLEVEAARQTPIRNHNCQLAQHQTFQRPFICYCCEVVYYHNNYLRNHIQCQQCKEVICAKCLLRQEDPQQLKAQLITNKSLRASCKQIIQILQTSLELQDRDLPEFGLCISIQRKSPKIETFRLVWHGNKKYILGRQGGEIYEVQKVQTHKQLAAFMRKYLIFRLDPLSAQNFVHIASDDALQKFILPKDLKGAYKKQKESLVVGEKLANEVLQNAFRCESSQGKDRIRKMFLDSNMIKKTDFIAKQFKNLVLLQLSYNPIENLEGLNRLTYLKSLALTSCQLKVLPEALYEVHSLEELRLSKNKLSSMPGINNLERLKLLDISNNNFAVLPSNLGECVNLILLRIDNNILSQLPISIQNLKQLRGLYSSMNDLKEIPPELGNLSSLQILELRQNHLTSIPEQLGKLFNLQKLDLTSNELSSLPNNFGDLQSLTDLYLRGNKQLKHLPNSFRQMIQLQQLDLSSCSFQLLPEQVSSLIALKKLNVSHNCLTALSKLQLLINLESLDASNNKLQTDQLTSSFQKLLKLQILNLKGNSLNQLPNLFYCQKLIKVDLSYNQIVTISEDDIAGLDTLQIFNLSNNRLKQISETIISLPKLKELNLSSNKLQKIGEGCITVWPTLLNINLSDNQLNEIPAWLYQDQQNKEASHIASIDISSNRIEQLPSELIKLKNLKTLKCGKNNIKKLAGELERFMVEKKIEVDNRDILPPLDVSPYRRTFNKSRQRRRIG